MFGIGKMTTRLSNPEVLKKNRSIVMVILALNFVHKMALKCYHIQEDKLMNGRFRHAPKPKWNNTFPIVLVHGYYGFGPDASLMLGNYFEYAL